MQWYHAIPLDLALLRLAAFQLFTFRWRKDGLWWVARLDNIGWHVSLENAGVTRNLGENTLGFSHHAAGDLKSQHFRIATWAQATPKHQFGDCVWSNAFNQRAGVHSDGANFDWEGDQGGGFCKPRLKLNPVDLAKAGQICLAVFFQCTSTKLLQGIFLVSSPRPQ